MAADIKKFFPKDPNDLLDYVFDWTKWLQSGETIDSFSITVSSGLTLSSSSTSVDGKKITIWISGGVSKLETATCRIVTTGGRHAYRTMGFNIESL